MELKRALVRLVGVTLLLAGIVGLLFSIAGLVVLDRVRDQAEAFAIGQLDLLEQALTTTAEGLALADTSLSQAAETVVTLEQTMSGVSLAVSDTVPMVDVIADLIGEQLPTTIGVTQDTLYSVATSAQVVDDVLALITSIPFLGTARYDPKVPLHLGFEEVAASLDGIPESLVATQDGLTATRDHLQGLQQDFAAMAEDIGQVGTSVKDAQLVLDQYQEIVIDLQEMLSSVRQSLPGWLAGVQVAASLLLIWVGIAQLGLITQGWELMGRSRVRTGKTSSAEENS
jgi:hypothetical protein